MLRYNGTIIINYGSRHEWDTNLDLEDNVWYQIILSWSARFQRLNIYLLREESKNGLELYRVKDFPDDTNPFKNGGSLSLGKFQVIEDEPGWKTKDKFVGCFDSLAFASE